jgi:hypothetical protein
MNAWESENSDFAPKGNPLGAEKTCVASDL